MPNCALANCRNTNKCTKGTNIKYFKFPKKEDLAKQWIIACQREDRINLKNATICSIHFEEKYFEIPLKQRLLNYSPKNARNLKVEAVPTLNLPGGTLGTAQKRKSEERILRLVKRRRREEVKDISKSSASTSSCTLGHSPETITEEAKFPTHDEQQLISTLPNTEKDRAEPQSAQTCLCGSRAELVELRQKIKILESQNKHLLKKIKETRSNTAQKYNTLLAKAFTSGQIKTLLNPKRMIRWSTKDIASAISLRSVSPKAYRYLRANNYPLPAMSTLRR